MPDKNTRQGAVQGVADDYVRNSPYNELDFIIRMILNNDVATATPVKVLAVEGGGAENPVGYVDVLPLISAMDAQGNTIDPVAIYHLPYHRYQGGRAAIVVDPEPGDIGLAMFAKQDASNLGTGTENPVQPGSFRSFDMADGFYYGGFLNEAPSVYIELKQDNSIVITASAGVTVKAPTVTVPTGDVIASGVSLKNHVHTNAGGSGNSGPPA